MEWYCYVILVIIVGALGGAVWAAYEKGFLNSDSALSIFLTVLKNVRRAEEEVKGNGRGAEKKMIVVSLLKGVFDENLLSTLIDTTVSVLNAVGWNSSGIVEKIARWIKRWFDGND